MEKFMLKLKPRRYQRPTNVIIGVLVNFDDKMRKEVKRAANIAKINVVLLLNEPEASLYILII